MTVPDGHFLDNGINGPHENIPNAWGYNHATLRGRWPRIAEAIAGASVAEFGNITGTPFPALVYRGKQLVSAFDPRAEAEEQAEDMAPGGAVYCYGIGMGHLPGVLAERHEHVYVVVMNLAIARAAFESAQMPWLTAPNVTLKIAADVPTLFVPYACVGMECLLADEQGHPLRDRLFADLNSKAMADLVLRPRERQDAQHAEENGAHTRVDTHVNALFGVRAGERFVIVGGGPTLMDEMGWLLDDSNRQSGMTMIAASSVLRTLIGHGIRPGIVVTVDTDPANIVQLEGIDLEETRDIALVYHPQVTPKIIGAWKGPRYFFSNELFMGGTVVHACADLAVQMGASEIHMVGLDFCFPAGKSHAEGHQDKREVATTASLRETIDGNGQRVYTGANLAQYHRFLENYIAKCSGVRWVKHGRAGVPVRGSEWAAR